MGSAKPGNHLKSGKMVKSVGFFFFKSTAASQVNFFRFGQIVFNLARTFAAHHKEATFLGLLRSLLINYLITLNLEKRT